MLQDVTESVKPESPQQANGAVPGVAYVKVPSGLVGEMTRVALNGVTRATADTRLTRALVDVHANGLEPLFVMDSRYEKRMRKAGLDRWFIVRFDENQNLSETLASLTACDCFEYVEETYLTSLPDVTASAFAPFNRQALASAEGETYPFDDELLPSQWHYQNYGNTPSSVVGADINLFEAWKRQTGNRQVIVSVIDGGVDVTHEDLVDNLWVNEGEIPGDGIDNDGNGYVDDINGYNFVDNTGKITFRASGGHATHVAGTIAARNGNGIGVCGVAGGDATHPGVRIMSCEKFNDYGNGITGEQTFVYAANNGAVISQNSWGYTFPGVPELPQSMKEAIDYFIDYAGCDNEGNQLPDSPMKGGVVIFAAGNDGKDYVCYPSAYDRVISVSAMAPDWQVAYYSNRGDWVDIMAPGGDLRSMYGGTEGEILSTLPPSVYKGVGYGYMQGTSMACPHVSGVAALIVSEFGGQGFTNDELRKRLEGALRPENIDEHNPDYAGRLGVGYIDAGKVFATNGFQAPESVTDLTAKADFTSIALSWTAVADKDDEAPVKYHLYTSTSAFDAGQLKEVPYIRINATGVKPGSAMEYVWNNLEPGTDYYMAMVAVDRWEQASAQPQYIKVSTRQNHAPVVTGLPTGTIVVKGSQKQTVSLTVTDEDGHKVTHRLEGDTRGVTTTYKDQVMTIDIRAIASPGVHSFTLILTDELGATTSAVIRFEVAEAQAPVVLSEVPEQTLKSHGAVKTLRLDDYFSFEEGTVFTASSSNTKVAQVAVDGTTLSVTSGEIGEATITVEAENGGKLTSTTFDVFVTQSGEPAEGIIKRIYPQPATRYLHVVFGSTVKEARITLRSLFGERIYRQTHAVKDGEVVIDVQKLSAGAYTLIAESEEETSTKTFVKQ